MLENIEVKEVVEKKKFEDTEEFDHYRYDPESSFDAPIVIHGTKKQLVPYPLIRIKKSDSKVLPTLLSNQKITESSFKDVILESTDKLELISIQDKGFACKVEKEGNPLFLFIEKHSTLAFPGLCKILKVPAAYAAKNPEDLNQANFDYWKKRMGESKTPIRISYREQNPMGFQYEGNLVSGFIVQTIFPAAFNKQGDKKEAIQIPLEMDQAQLHLLVPKICEILKLQQPTVEFHLDQIDSGYETGDHFLKILMNDPGLNLIVNGVEYQPFVSILANYDCFKKSENRVLIRLGWQALATGNAFLLPLREDYAKQIQEAWVKDRLTAMKIPPTDKRFEKVLKRLEKKARKMLGGYQLTLSVGEVMNSLDRSELAPMFGEFISQRIKFQELLQELSEEWIDLSTDVFVETTDSLARKIGIPDSFIKYLVLTYMNGSVVFKCPLDLVNFVCFAAQSGKLSIQRKVENVALVMGKAWHESFIRHKSHRPQIVEKFQEMVKI